jgi:hypothetical protein
MDLSKLNFFFTTLYWLQKCILWYILCSFIWCNSIRLFKTKTLSRSLAKIKNSIDHNTVSIHFFRIWPIYKTNLYLHTLQHYDYSTLIGIPDFFKKKPTHFEMHLSFLIIMLITSIILAKFFKFFSKISSNFKMLHIIVCAIKCFT